MTQKTVKRIHVKRDEITAVYADPSGNICEAPGMRALGRIGMRNIELLPEELIPLPQSADLMFMPAHTAVGQGMHGEEEPLAGTAVAAILPQGYTRTYLPAFQRRDHADPLPLYGYTAVVSYRGKLCVTAVYTD